MLVCVSICPAIYVIAAHYSTRGWTWSRCVRCGGINRWWGEWSSDTSAHFSGLWGGNRYRKSPPPDSAGAPTKRHCFLDGPSWYQNSGYQTRYYSHCGETLLMILKINLGWSSCLSDDVGIVRSFFSWNGKTKNYLLPPQAFCVSFDLLYYSEFRDTEFIQCPPELKTVYPNFWTAEESPGWIYHIAHRCKISAGFMTVTAMKSVIKYSALLQRLPNINN